MELVPQGSHTVRRTWNFRKGHDYIFPDTNAIKLLMDNGMNIFRVQFLMERLTPNGMTGSFDSAYLKNMTRVRTTKYAIVACTRLTRVGGGPPPAAMRSLDPTTMGDCRIILPITLFPSRY